MKKTLLWLLLLVLFPFPAFCAGRGAYVNTLQGEARVTRNTETRALKKGDRVLVSETVSVAKGGRVDISINDLAGVRLLSDSVLLLEDDRLAMTMNLLKGDVLVNLRKLPSGSSFHLGTPTAIAAVRGTQFWGRMDASKGLVTTMAVREGEIEVRDRATSGRVTVKAGEAVDITAGKPAAVRKALPAELEAMRAAPEIPTGR